MPPRLLLVGVFVLAVVPSIVRWQRDRRRRHRLVDQLAPHLADERRAPSAHRVLRQRGRLALLLATLGVVAVLVPPAAIVVVGAWWAVPRLRARAVHRRTDARVVEELPEVIDVLRLALEAGTNVFDAVSAVARFGSGVVADELRVVVARVEQGDRLSDALDGLGTLGLPARPLVETLTAADRYGTPVARGLERAATEARAERRRRGEEAARRVPVKMLFPLVLCTLPALGLLTVVPVVARSLPSIGP